MVERALFEQGMQAAMAGAFQRGHELRDGFSSQLLYDWRIWRVIGAFAKFESQVEEEQ